jgi:hypothetical protein
VEGRGERRGSPVPVPARGVTCPPRCTIGLVCGCNHLASAGWSSCPLVNGRMKGVGSRQGCGTRVPWCQWYRGTIWYLGPWYELVPWYTCTYHGPYSPTGTALTCTYTCSTYYRNGSSSKQHIGTVCDVTFGTAQSWLLVQQL